MEEGGMSTHESTRRVPTPACRSYDMKPSTSINIGQHVRKALSYHNR